MNVIVNESALLLAPAQTVELVDAAGATATLDEGCLWITMDGDRRDIVLHAGDRWKVERNGRTIVHAQAPSRLHLEPPQRRHGPPVGIRGTLRAWLNRVISPVTAAPYY